MSMRVLLVDDHALFRDGMAALFSYQSDFVVVGNAANAADAVALTRSLQPDLVLMDIDLGGEDGVAVTAVLKAEFPDVKVVILTVYDDTEKLLEAVKAGASGYLVKNIKSNELLDRLRDVARGDAAITRRMASRILEEFRRTSQPTPPETLLTARELEVLELVASRLSNKEIAMRLVISENTVKNHMKSILGKLQLRSRREAAAYGVAQGWVAPGSSNAG